MSEINGVNRCVVWMYLCCENEICSTNRRLRRMSGKYNRPYSSATLSAFLFDRLQRHRPEFVYMGEKCFALFSEAVFRSHDFLDKFDAAVCCSGHPWGGCPEPPTQP